MPRNLDPATTAALAANSVGYAVMADIAFRSSVQHVWSGPGAFAANGFEYVGIGSLGMVGEISEGAENKAEGTSLTLSGIDPTSLSESMTDVELGAPVSIWLVLLTPQMTVIGQPYLWFAGKVDQPPVAVGGESFSITLKVETALIDHERANALKYTSADQRLMYPDDTGFDWVEQENDKADRWGN